MISTINTPIKLSECTRHQQTEICSEYFSYAAYMYMGLDAESRYPGQENGILLASRFTRLNEISTKPRALLQTIIEEIGQIGFEVDQNGNFYSLETGTIFNLVYDKRKNEIILCLMGLNKHSELMIDEDKKEILRKSSYTAARRDFCGHAPGQPLNQIVTLGNMLSSVTHSSKLKPVIVGHSHGGGLAQTAALVNGLKGVVFNSRPIGVGTIEFIGEESIQANASKLTAFSVEGDWLTSEDSMVNQLARVFLFWSQDSLPRSFGTTYLLPQLEEYSSHGYFYHSFYSIKKLES